MLCAAGAQPVLGRVRQETSITLRIMKFSPGDAYFGNHQYMLTAGFRQAAAAGPKPDSVDENGSLEEPWE